jgi:hypothetical protein
MIGYPASGCARLRLRRTTDRRKENAMHVTKTAVLVALSLSVSLAAWDRADAKTVQAGNATASWSGRGVIQDIGDGDSVFSGRITGTMFIRHGQETGRARIHAAKIECHTLARLRQDDEEQQTALCVIAAHEGKDVAYAEARCTGKKDDCRGEFVFRYGVGAFAGITGATPFVAGINIERKEDGRIYGYAEWPNLTYSVP